MQSLVMQHIEDFNQFMKWIDRINPNSEPEKYLFRGLSDHNYQVEASAWRRLPSGHDVNSLEPFLEINKNLIKEARLQGHDHRNGRELFDLEVLAELQHFGAATCLIDFTYSAQVALWFACQQDPNQSLGTNGKVAAVLNIPEIIKEVTADTVKKHCDYFFNGDNGDNERMIDSELESVLYRWQPRQLNNRILSQQSVFVLGDKHIRPNEACIIRARCKENILKSLEKHANITGKTLFPDFEGFARQHSHDKDYRFPDYATLADREFQRSEFDRALSNLNKVIELEPNDPWHFYRRAHVKYYLGMHNSRLEYLNEANRDLHSALTLTKRTTEETEDRLINQIKVLRELIQKAYQNIQEPHKV